MFTMKVKIETSAGKWTATVIDYRFFGLLFYRKTLIPPQDEAEYTSCVYKF